MILRALIAIVLLLACPDVAGAQRSSIMKREDAPGVGPRYPRASGYRMPRSSGRYRWPWDVRTRPAQRVRVIVRPVIIEKPAPAPQPRLKRDALEPDCDEVNKYVEALPANKLARALLRSSDRQKRIIAECQEKKPVILNGFR